MDFFSRLLNSSTDGQLIVQLSAHQLSALLIKANKFVGQVTLEENSPEASLAPLQALMQEHSCRKPEVTIVLDESCYQQTQIDKPSVPDTEVRAALPWAVKDLIAIAPENMQVDYFDMPDTSSAKRITAVATEKKWLSDWVNFFSEQLKGEVKSVQVEELAVLNLLQHEEVPVLLLWQKPNKEAEVLLVHQQALYLSRNLRGTSGLDHMRGELLAGVVDNISLEVQRALDYFESNLRQPPVRKIYLMLESESIGLIRELMAANLAAEVQVFEHPQQDVMKLPDHITSLPLLGAMLLSDEEVAA